MPVTRKYLSILALVIFPVTQYCIAQTSPKPRILISTDIGGTDPDDNQSMIHLLMNADRVRIEGLLSTSFIKGRKENILEMIRLYEQDRKQLKRHAKDFPSEKSLIKITKQGATAAAPYKGYATATEGSNWMIHCARKKSTQPLWVLVWGGLEDLAQALHDAPDIKKNIRVYWIGGPNKKWGVNAYDYIATHHPDLWFIEANATYRGWFMDTDSPDSLRSSSFYKNYILGHGAMANDFVQYYGGVIKMGDTPSLAYLLNGDPNDPMGESWGGSFIPIRRSAKTVFNRLTTSADTVATYSVIEWRFKGPSITIHPDSSCFLLEAAGQQWPGYYIGNGNYAVRYSPKQMESRICRTISAIPDLNGLSFHYVSVNPWPGQAGSDDYRVGANWYSDRADSDLFIENQQGAKTISKHRVAFLTDWALRWSWLDKK